MGKPLLKDFPLGKLPGKFEGEKLELMLETWVRHVALKWSILKELPLQCGYKEVAGDEDTLADEAQCQISHTQSQPQSPPQATAPATATSSDQGWRPDPSLSHQR